jgi:hypothetical protein
MVAVCEGYRGVVVYLHCRFGNLRTRPANGLARRRYKGTASDQPYAALYMGRVLFVALDARVEMHAIVYRA